MNFLISYYVPLAVYLSGFAAWAYLLLRLVFGLVFIVHGWPKLKSLKTTHKNFEAMGFKPGSLWGTVVALVEFFGGLAVFLGLLTSLAASLLVINMIVATVWKLSRKQGFVGGYEFDLLLVIVGLTLATIGPSGYSLDLWLFAQ